MFYSHEILTSPEHGVATIWLVATLGSRSIARRLNRKAILDVDVPNACRVIINPDAPMALRLQGSLLYGLSRVYNQQCGYTLLDTQTMHDKMVSKLKIIPGSGLDPAAGKTRPSNLILPYDPSFFPETALPGLDIDLSYFTATTDDSSSQLSGLWTKSPNSGLSGTSRHSSLHLELPSDDVLGEGTILGIDEINRPAQKTDAFHNMTGLEPANEEGVLLQPDFEFDEDGNIIELGDRGKIPPVRKSTVGLRESEGLKDNQQRQLYEDSMQNDNEEVRLTETNDMMELDTQTAGLTIPQTNEGLDGFEETIEIEVTKKRRVRRPKEIISDDTTALRNMTMAQWPNGYVANMTYAMKQKQQNKIPAISKKNAAFWVFGQGIGSVGVGLGMDHEAHPLRLFSGESLFEAVGGYPRREGRKRSADDSEISERRRVRAREEQTEYLSRENIDRLNMEVEVGRDAPSSLFDDHSSQMPWNATASIQSSRQRHRFGSLSELSSQGRKARSRLTSASPLAGRSYLGGQDRLSLELLGDFEDDLNLTQYLEGELATDREKISSLSPSKRSALERAKSTLDRESLNFIDFMKTKMGATEKSNAGNRVSPNSNESSSVAARLETTFANLLPPGSTTRAVATQALMNILTLATKGVLHVHQDGYIDESTEWAVCYRYGEIFLRLSGTQV
ncbi:Rad21/Rec8-like protein, N-terminal [Penicillium digitatum]|uniref:Rad21/Rec8-like protein, N-terminal n=2 Tax=Penicillium digitatum TaxID=36651 RepID=A0A7T6XNY1_PENDI|nr:Rad21/Rec8-like protein, N-terminal [Penicillium digitatum]